MITGDSDIGSNRQHRLSDQVSANTAVQRLLRAVHGVPRISAGAIYRTRTGLWASSRLRPAAELSATATLLKLERQDKRADPCRISVVCKRPISRNQIARYPRGLRTRARKGCKNSRRLVRSRGWLYCKMPPDSWAVFCRRLTRSPAPPASVSTERISERWAATRLATPSANTSTTFHSPPACRIT